MRYCLTLLLFFVVYSITAQHTIPVLEEDTVLLDIDNYRGALQWQISEDEVSWTDIDDETTGTLKYVPVTFPTWFRLKITEGDCDPHYSEVVKVIVPSLPTVTTSDTPIKVRPYNLDVEGEVTDDGGAPIIARGVVYGTSSTNLNLENALFTSEGTGTGSFVSKLFNLASNTAYFVRAYATNMKGTTYGTLQSFYTVNNPYRAGDTGPAGGIIFYDNGYVTNGWRYLEAAPKHWSGSDDPWFNIDWGCNETFVGGTSTAVGTGKENTDILIAEDCIGPQSPASIANDAVINGFDDWFLPSRDELQILFDELFEYNSNFRYIFGFNNISYSSSSEIDATSVWGVGFGGGTEQQNSKTVDSAIRPVRRF